MRKRLSNPAYGIEGHRIWALSKGQPGHPAMIHRTCDHPDCNPHGYEAHGWSDSSLPDGIGQDCLLSNWLVFCIFGADAEFPLTTPTQCTNADEAPCIDLAMTSTVIDLPIANMTVETANATKPSMYVARRDLLLSAR